MRKITSQASEAFWGLKNYNQSNTHVWHREGKSFLSLHGNRIAELKDDALYITDCGWATTTTKERLNGILDSLGYYIQQKNGEWRLLKFGETFKEGREFEREQSGWSFANTLTINL